MAVSKFAASTELNYEVNGGKGDHFDLLGCPDEIVEQFFSYLNFKDGTRMRLNKRLSKIESKSKYYLEKVELGQMFFDASKPVNIQNRRYPFDFISRIARRTTIGDLEIYIPHSVEVYHKFCNIIKEFRCITGLSIFFSSSEEVNEIMTRSFFLDLPRRCESLNFTGLNMDQITPEILHNLYKGVSDVSVRVRHLTLSSCKRKNFKAFLNFIGIYYNRHGLLTARRKVEIYKDYHPKGDDDEHCVNIFDGFVQISFEEWSMRTFRNIVIILHENLEALNSAKNTPPKKGFRRFECHED